ncbi:M4 family metallopeptidase [Dyadobacter sp. CY323]|uniref:M4 family metallopeptidase n=1 Tax=Dyadobacter sp. CY323 TaxID=2907302 RepID=UPI001F3B3084|nr:M4 family metallopeptidase [Dyadobacter sp. CY323]MCE6991761.1 M4 family metallopeptidase [Dyadobacter sp. CY323]
MIASSRALVRRVVVLLLFFVGNWLVPQWFSTDCIAQPFYESKTYNPAVPATSGSILGVLYNSQPYLIQNTPTTYHGIQNVYATAYLPFIETEFNAAKPIQLFGSYYTTAIALCSPKDPAKGLYAPVHIISEEPKSNNIYALAAVIPYSPNNLNFKGPFNKLKYLNVNAPGFANPVSSEYGITALKTAQEFTKFSHEMLTDQDGIGWNGFDQAGNVPITCVIKPTVGKTYYDHDLNLATFFKYKTGTIEITRSIMGHEFFHGMVENSLGYDLSQASATRLQMEEGIANIIALGFSNWLSPTKFENPNWNLFWENPGDPQVWVNNPKIRFRPNTYKGQYYKENWLAEDYNVHDNGHIVTCAFVPLVEGKSGHVDDNPANAPYTVLQLVPGNKSESYKLALRIFFNAFIRKLSLNAEYPDLRMATLAAATDLGYVKGTHAYKQLEAAWSAVGVEGTFYNKNCVKVTAESLLNGPVNFNAQEGTLFPHPLSQKMNVLYDCSNYNPVGTYFKNTATGYGTSYGNAQIYSEDADLSKSKIMVSVHHFTQVARDWFMSKLGLDGMNGKGQFITSNLFTEQESFPFVFTLGSTNPSAHIPYTYDSLSACRDQVSRNYFHGVDTFNKYDQIQVTPSSDWKAISTSLSHIFALEIKKDYEIQQQDPSANQIRTLYEEMPNDAYLIDFENPQLRGQPVVYHGVNWDDANPLSNAGVVNKVYDLLIHGSDGPDGTENPGGYFNGEADSEPYVIFQVDKDIVLKTFWAAYKEASVAESLDDFRLATMKALKTLYPAFDEKSKQHIAFRDAWAAAFNMPDYASTLEHFPKNNQLVYPWKLKVGYQKEYAMESEHLFEISESSKFNSDVAPVYQFTNNATSSEDAGMMLGTVNLEGGKHYFIRSRLSKAGDLHEGCATSPDPLFCELLSHTLKWTITEEFETEKVDAAVAVYPLPDDEVPAWSNEFKWGGVRNAAGYDFAITDIENGVTHPLEYDSEYDEEASEHLEETILALSKEKKYQWSIAGRQKLGSPNGARVLLNSIVLPLTTAEKEAFPNTYSPWIEPIDFVTTLPKIIPGNSPTNQEHKPLLGPAFTLTASKEDNADGYYFEYQEPYHKSSKKDLPEFPFLLSNVPGIAHLEEIKWRFKPMKEPVDPFITEIETGESEWRSFVADMDLSPKPELDASGLVCFDADKEVKFSWQKVDQATHYRFKIKTPGGGEIANSVTTDLFTGPVLNASSADPGKYIFEVSAGYKNTDEEMFWGPASSLTYGIRPPAPVGLQPNGNNALPLQNGSSVTFSWQPGPGVALNTQHQVRVSEEGNMISSFSNLTMSGTGIIYNQAKFDTQYDWKVNNLSTISGCPSQWTQASFKTQEEPAPEEPDEEEAIKSDLAFTLEEPTNDDFDMIIKTPSGNVFTYDDATRYVQDTQGDLGPDIAFFNHPEEGTYELTVLIYQRNHLVCPVPFTLKALENGVVKKILADELPVICEFHFTGAEIGQFVNNVATTFKYTYTK